MYRILSFDGGGIMGLLSAVILKRIIQERESFLNNVDLVSGTSTGGIIALGLAAGLSIDQIIDLYLNKGDDIFQSRGFWDWISLDELIRANYSQETLKQILTDEFQEKIFKDVKIRSLIPAYDLEAQKTGFENHARPKFWDSNDAKDGQKKIVDIALMTSAAPTFFPTYQGFADGALFANNPSDSAIGLALKEGHKDISLLSIGTGFQAFKIADEFNNGEIASQDWGLSQWAPHLIDLIMMGLNITSDYKSKQLLKNKYLRINPAVDIEIKLDSIDKMKYLIDIAESLDLSGAIQWTDEHWFKNIT